MTNATATRKDNRYGLASDDETFERLLSSPPLGFNAGDTNLYRYVGNSSVNFTDPSGLQARDGSSGGSVGRIGFTIGGKETGSLECSIDANPFDDLLGRVVDDVFDRDGGMSSNESWGDTLIGAFDPKVGVTGPQNEWGSVLIGTIWAAGGVGNDVLGPRVGGTGPGGTIPFGRNVGFDFGNEGGVQGGLTGGTSWNPNDNTICVYGEVNVSVPRIDLPGIGSTPPIDVGISVTSPGLDNDFNLGRGGHVGGTISVPLGPGRKAKKDFGFSF